MKSFKYILIDFDGCMIKSLYVWLVCYKEILAKRDLYPSDEEIISKAFGLAAEGLKTLGIKDYKEAYEELTDLVARKIVDSELFDGVTETLKLLKTKGKKIALLTSSGNKVVNPMLKKYDIEKYFDIVLTKEDVKNSKPHPEIAEKAIDLLHGEKANSVIIGDSKFDIQTGKNAGVSTILFDPVENRKFYENEDLKKEKPDYVVEFFKDILKVVN